MKMKMFVGRTEEEAMAMVRAEMGPDAVILSTRDEEGRVEVRAAIEQDHTFYAGFIGKGTEVPELMRLGLMTTFDRAALAAAAAKMGPSPSGPVSRDMPETLGEYQLLAELGRGAGQRGAEAQLNGQAAFGAVDDGLAVETDDVDFTRREFGLGNIPADGGRHSAARLQRVHRDRRDLGRHP